MRKRIPDLTLLISKDLFNSSRTQRWKSYNYMDSKTGPKLDHSCQKITDSNKNLMVLSVGGGEHQILNRSEIFKASIEEWEILQNNDLPFLGLRSSAMIEMNNTPYLIGGMKCNATKSCSPMNSVFEFDIDQKSWTEISNATLSIPRYGHLLMYAPQAYFPECSSIINKGP